MLLSDILHQLYKKIVTNFMGELTKSIKEKQKSTQMAKKGTYQAIKAWANKQSHTTR